MAVSDIPRKRAARSMALPWTEIGRGAVFRCRRRIFEAAIKLAPVEQSSRS